ncbi:MAG TPA: DUF2948 family protein [Paracoccus sp. (in: a-proteobacteria)]|nr:DUF2948 family protein [Paracoccus sp. (in: a-proteobacteria)]
MTDARFADADLDRPLALRAETPEELPILAALAQDAVLTVGDVGHDARHRRLALLVSRFRWEDAEAAEREGRPFERVRALLVVSDVMRVLHDGIDMSWVPGEDGTGRLLLRFAGDGTIAAEAECLSVDLRDVSRPHQAVSGHMPRHED